MYEGQRRTYYGGIAGRDGTFLLSAFVNDLTAPDELPYLTNQMLFDAVDGWQSQIWYPDDFITSYAMLNGPIALSRAGILFDATSGDEVADVDTLATTHFNTLTAIDGIMTIAGDNGRYWNGSTESLTCLDNPIHLPLPAPNSPIEEKIAWGEQMQQVYASLALGPRDVLIGGARGFLVRFIDGKFHAIPIGVDAHVTGLSCGDDGTIYVCGHTPNSFVGIVHPDNMVQVLTELKDGPKLHSPSTFQSVLLVGATGTDGGLFSVSANGLENYDLEGTSEFGELRFLSADAPRLWAVYESALVVLENQSYRVHRHPSNV